MATGNLLYDAAKALMPTLRFVPTDPKLYTCFAVACDESGTCHMLAHYSEHSLLYVKVGIEDGRIALDLTFKRHVEDLMFDGATELGELFMVPSIHSLDFDWYRRNLRRLFEDFVNATPGEACRGLPSAFRPEAVGQNNGPVMLRLQQHIHHPVAATARPTIPVESPRHAY